MHNGLGVSLEVLASVVAHGSTTTLALNPNICTLHGICHHTRQPQKMLSKRLRSSCGDCVSRVVVFLLGLQSFLCLRKRMFWLWKAKSFNIFSTISPYKHQISISLHFIVLECGF